MRISSLCFVLALAGCGKDKAKASEAPPTPPTPAPAATSSVQIFVDDAVSTTIGTPYSTPSQRPVDHMIGSKPRGLTPSFCNSPTGRM